MAEELELSSTEDEEEKYVEQEASSALAQKSKAFHKTMFKLIIVFCLCKFEEDSVLMVRRNYRGSCQKRHSQT